MVGVCIIFVLGAMFYSSSSPNAVSNPLDIININLNVGKGNNGEDYYESGIEGKSEDGHTKGNGNEGSDNDYGYKRKFKNKYRNKGYKPYKDNARCVATKCDDGSVSPTPPGECCPDKKLCLNCTHHSCFIISCLDRSLAPMSPGSCCRDGSLCPINFNSTPVQCFPKRCPDGNLAPTAPWWPEEECCNTGNVGGWARTCIPTTLNPGSGSVCCPDAGRCKLPPRCSDCSCSLTTCKDGSSPGYMKDECCPTPSFCLDPDF